MKIFRPSYILMIFIGFFASPTLLSEQQAIVVEGTLQAVSALSNPINSDYPDANYTAKLLINQIIDGKPLPKEILLIIPGFREYKIVPSAEMKKGETRRFEIISYDDLSAKEQAIGQCDDLNLFELPNYFVIRSDLIKNFSIPDSPIPFVMPSHYSPFDNPINPPVSSEAADAKEFFIRRDLEYLNSRLADMLGHERELTQKFSLAWREKQKEYELLPEEYRGLSFFWRKIDNSFVALTPRHSFASNQISISEEKIIALQHYRDFFESNGVQLIIQIYPMWNDISARLMMDEFRNFADYHSAVIAKQLLEAGIETIYSADALIMNFAKYDLLYLCPYDFHPTGGNQDVQTNLILERLERFKGKLQDNNTKTELFSIERCNTNYGEKFFWPAGVNIGENIAGTPYQCDHIFYNGKPLEFNRNSRLMIISNSYGDMPMQQGGTYAAYLGRKINYIPDYRYFSGNGPAMSAPLAIFNNYQRDLQGKLLVIMPVGAGMLVSTPVFLDLRKLDEGKKRLANTRLLDEIPIDIFASPESECRENIKHNHASFRKLWQDFLKQNRGAQVAIPKNKIADHFPAIDLNGKIDPTKPLLIRVTATSFPRQANYLVINGQKQSMVPSFHLEWHSFLFELPAGTDKLDIKFETVEEFGLLSLKEIWVLQ